MKTINWKLKKSDMINILTFWRANREKLLVYLGSHEIRRAFYGEYCKIYHDCGFMEFDFFTIDLP